MGPAAILSVLVRADTAAATVQLTKFDRQLAAVNDKTKKDIKAQLGANFNDSGFRAYQDRVDRAARVARDREAFKAQLGANFNAAGFNAYQRQVDRAKLATNTATSSTGRLGSGISSMGGKAVGVAGALAGMSFGLTTMAKFSLDASIQFQKAMLLVHTQAGYAEADVKRLSQSILELAPKVGYGPDELSKALFHIASSGVPASKAMDVLKAASEGARVGAADLEQTTNALVGILRTAPKDVHGAADAMASLSAIVGQGNMRMNDLTAAMRTGVLPAAKVFGLGLKDVGAALDVMTSRGIPATRAATALRMTFSLMAAPTSKAAAAFATIGMGTNQLANDMRKPEGLLVAMTDLKKHLEDAGLSAVDQAQVLAHAFGGGRTSAGIMTLLVAVDDLKKHTDNLKNQTGTSALDKAFALTQKDAGTNVDRMKATMQVLGIVIGKAIQPILPVLADGAMAISKFVDQMNSGKGAGGEFSRVMVVVGKVVGTAFTILWQIMKVAMGVIVTSIEAGVKAAGWLSNAFNNAKHAVQEALDAILGGFSGLLRGIAEVANVGSGIPLIGSMFGSAANKATTAADSIDNLRRSIDGLPTHKTTNVGVNIDFTSNIAGAIQSIGASIGGALGAHGGTGVTVGGQGHFAKGGLVRQPGYFAGEEAPQHPEVILATNPAYRQRNRELWLKAGGLLGIPGFATGGLAGAEVTATPPWATQHAAALIRPAAQAWGRGHGMDGRMVAAANHLVGLPYIFGGGHGSFSAPGYDCSGAVSYILHAAGMLSSPMDTTGLKSWGDAGPGKYITVGVRGTSGMNAHTMMEFFGKFFESGGSGGGPHWDMGWDGAFPIMRHPPGFQQGGIVGDFGDVDPALLLRTRPDLVKLAAFREYMKRFRRFATGGIYTASDFVAGPHTASGRTYIPGYAELSRNYNAPVSQLDFGALGHVPMGTMATVTYGGRHINIPKIDVGAGGPGLHGHVRGIDLSTEAAQLLGFSGLADVLVSFASAGGGGTSRRASRGPRSNLVGGLPAGSPPNLIGRLPGGTSSTAGGGGAGGWARTWQALLLGMPPPPHVTGQTPTTIAGAGKLQGVISASRNLIARLESKEGSLESFFNVGSMSFTDSAGNVDTAAVNKALADLNIVIGIREQIFQTWQIVVVLTGRLIAANQMIVKKLENSLSSIRTHGLKGKALAHAQKKITDTKTAIAKIKGNLASAVGDLQTGSDSRDQAWLALGTLRDSYKTIASTTSTAAAAPAPTAASNTTIDQLQQTLQQWIGMQQGVTSLQGSVLQNFAGAFQSGGTLSQTGWALVGERGPELAHLPAGTHILPSGQTANSTGAGQTITVIVQDGAVDPNKIRVIAGDETRVILRQQTRLGTRSLPGAGGGR